MFAVESLRHDDVILRLDDSRVVDEEHPLRHDRGEFAKHRDFLPDGTVTLMQSPERHINHSCEPNVYIYSANRERFLLARRDIAAGEEILMDYALNAADGDEWECRCGAGACRGYHKCDFFTLPTQRQREYLPYLDPWFASVHAARIRRLLVESL
jgi:SET domain-containing protein